LKELGFMKQSMILNAVVMIFTGLAGTLALANPLDGTYQVIKSDCDRTGTFFVGDVMENKFTLVTFRPTAVNLRKL